MSQETRTIIFPNTCTFSGYIKDDNNDAIENATVIVTKQNSLTNVNDTTDSNGYWAVNLTSDNQLYTVFSYYNSTLNGNALSYINNTC